MMINFEKENDYEKNIYYRRQYIPSLWSVFGAVYQGLFSIWPKDGEEHDRIRDKNAVKLLNRMTDIKNKYGCPVFSFGDFNCTIESTALKLLEENNIYTSFKLTENHSPIATYHGYPTRGEDGKFYGKPTTTDYTKSIDHFVTFKGDVVITKQEVVVYPEILGATDHSPIYVDIEF